MAAEKEIKTVKLYSDVERIYKQLEQLGYSKTDALKVEDVNKFDEYHYLGTDAVLYSIKELGINSSHKVLDFGSGLGGPARYIVASTNCELLAVELQADLNETALDLTKRCGLDGKLKHVCGDILKLDMEPASFDFLVNWLVILHIEDRKTLFDNCFRLLKPGGKIYTEDYFKLSDYDENFGKMLKRDLYIECLPTREEYIQQMEKAGFSDIKQLVFALCTHPKVHCIRLPHECTMACTEIEPLTSAGVTQLYLGKRPVWLVHDILRLDMTKEWTQFVDQRVRGFHAGKDRYISVFGQATYDELNYFYTHVSEIYRSSHIGGCRIIASKK